MSFFSWFSKKPPSATILVPGSGIRGNSGSPQAAFVPQGTKAAPPSVNPVAETSLANVDLKVRRHARREQLYAAIRDAMTRAGMLSASYKFKVLSLDQNGNQFLVMMDIAQDLTTSAEQLSRAEEILVQTAKAGFGIIVTSVYWRVDRKTTSKSATPYGNAAPAAPPAHVSTPEDADGGGEGFARTQADASDAPGHDRPRAVDVVASVRAIAPIPQTKNRHDPLLEAEVAAFKRALAAVQLAAVPPATRAAAVPAADADSRARIGSKSYTLITGFEDTEMPDSPAMPALSATQYGDLN